MSKIKKPSELTISPYLKVLVYGQPGIGKSTLALSFPDPVMIDCDRGVHRVSPAHLSDTVEVDSWTDVDQALTEIDSLKLYKSIIFDTGGRLVDYMTEYLISQNPKFKQGDGTFALKGYAARKRMFQTLLGRLHNMKMHVVFVAHEREERDGDTRFVRPEIGGSSGNDLIKDLDFVGYMEAIGKKRTISFAPTEKYYAKNSLQLEETIEVPDATIENTFMEKITTRYTNSIKERFAEGDEYADLVDLVQQRIDDVIDADTANEYLEWALSLKHIWDSKLKASRLLGQKVKELKISKNPETNKYE